MEPVRRRREIAAVRQLIDRVLAGSGGHLVLTGPPGSGKSTLARWAEQAATARGLRVHRLAVTGSRAGSTGSRLLGELAALAERPALPAGAGPEEVDALFTATVEGPPRLLVIDDLDADEKAGSPDTGGRFPVTAPHVTPGTPLTEAVRLFAGLAPHLATGATAVLATTTRPTGLPPELRLGGLDESELRALVGDMPAEAVHAVRLASAGLPGAALAAAHQLAAADGQEDPLTYLALAAPSRASFLDPDTRLIRLLEAADARPLPPRTRARVLARLARELLSDPTDTRRPALIEEALGLARASGSPGVVAEVLDSALHALWDPAATRHRLETGAEIVARARLAGDIVSERRGLMWRFTALMELGDLTAAEAALTSYARTGELTGDAEATVVVTARQSMLATIRGRFDEAVALAAEVEALGHRAGLPDARRLTGSLRGSIAALRGDWEGTVAPWQALDRRLPGHFFAATAARALAETGRLVEAELELERLLPRVLTGSGPRWLGAVADLAVVASRSRTDEGALRLRAALTPYRGRLVVWGGANTVTGPVDHYLAVLSTRLGDLDRAVTEFDAAEEWASRNGALPWLAGTLAARADALLARRGDGDDARARDDRERARSIAERLGMRGLLTALTPAGDEWRLVRVDGGWLLEAGPESARLSDIRGLGYLRSLLAAPGHDIPALDLVAGGHGLRAPDGDPVLDPTAMVRYRQRIQQLDEELDTADRVGDVDRARDVQRERNAITAELRRASGLGGRVRAVGAEAERARVSATRALWAAVKRIEGAAPLAGAHLRASLRSGRTFCYRPAAGGPSRWRV
ncbi:ATP-binding protein [Streptomyces sp. NPDC029526]|uniref:ATP-binding protein n=1 Tax=Streptomyces sp. NPDC029526 TaxID=3155728 RepID=UPI0033DBC4CE